MKYFGLYTIIGIDITITTCFIQMLRSIITVNTILIVIIEFGWILDAVFVWNG
jgi:hypothetical protein